MRKIFFIFLLYASIVHPKIIWANWEDDAMIPFWQGNTIYNESMLMVSYGGGTPEAPFLFPYTNILSVKNSKLDITYTPGTDWMYANNTLILPTGSRIPFIYDTDLTPNMYLDPAYFHDRQVVVTYTHSGSWHGPKPSYAGTSLPHTFAKLTSAQPVKIVLYGDSISVGYNASSVINRAPYFPVWGQLIINAIQKAYQSPITFLNSSVGGQTSAWGAQNIQSLVSNQYPDLVIIAFGMNDGVNMPPSIIPIDVNTFKNNLLIMINNVKAYNPQAEFILVSPTLMNPAYGGSIQANYKAEIQRLVQTGIVMVDMTGVHQELLKTKTFADITGNNINHPNDYLSRWYAQEVAGLFIPRLDTPTPTPIPTATPIPPTPTTAPVAGLPAQAGDFSGDRHVNDTDYEIIKKNFEKSYTIYDYNRMVENFGK